MRIKVTATHYVDALTWIEAEKQVEAQLSIPDTIESEPAGMDPRDIVEFAIASKIHDRHNKLFFDSYETDSSYEEQVEILKEQVRDWLSNILDDIISNNEEGWS